jgi:hypothetical protein
MNNAQKFEQFATNIGALVKESLIQTIEEQGHRYTGKLQDSIRYETESKGFLGRILFYAEYYSDFVDKGVPANRIPYNPSKRTGKKNSKYIDALIDFAINKLKVGSDNAKNVAFMIARKHAKEGMPTNNSSKFSKTGERLDYVYISIARVRQQIRQLLIQLTKEVFKFAFIKINL